MTKNHQAVSRGWTIVEVQKWAARVRADRVSETGRAMVDLAERALLDAMVEETVEGTARLYLAIDKLVRASYQGDKQHNDNTLERLRSKLEDGAELALSLKDLH